MIYGKVIERCLYCGIHIVFVCRQNTRYSGFIVILTTDYKQNRFTPIIAHHKGKPRNKAKKYSLPPRGKAFLMQSFQGSEIVSNANATIRYETGEACKAVGKLQACEQQSVTKQAKPAALNMPPESRGRLKARAPCLRARRCPFPARTPATRRKALSSRSVPPAARWCPVR